MRKELLATCLFSMIVMAPSAMAQYGSKPPEVTVTNIGIRLGVGIPIDPTLRSVASQFIGVGVEYTLQEQLYPNSYTFFSADWFGKSGSGEHGNLFPVAINERFYLNAKREEAFYGVLGLGAIFVDTGSSSQTGAVLRGGIGYNFGPNLFGEVNAFVGTPVPGVKPSGVGIYLGYRF